ncbi:Hypothetical predicted protein [Olea europaea subsp. europaea]|uniref:Uncharacterized protein n=1 Tax=Olea europaea subsp. europaea TaxID=158383 RepID=A0A8S0TL96_OLEEU|nr:Hypothetical predicted protein [Olea europaea subsp. europaea]
MKPNLLHCNESRPGRFERDQRLLWNMNLGEDGFERDQQQLIGMQQATIKFSS